MQKPKFKAGDLVIIKTQYIKSYFDAVLNQNYEIVKYYGAIDKDHWYQGKNHRFKENELELATKLHKVLN